MPPARRVSLGALRWLLGLLLAAGSPGARAGEGPSWQRDPVLSPLLIQQMVTDAAGFRWVATDEGVYRYDGYEAVPLQNLVRRGPRPRVERVSTLVFDGTGTLWIGSETGLCRFEPVTGLLQPVTLPLAPDERPRVNALLHDPRTGRVWVGCGAGAVLLFAAARPQQPLFPVRRVADTGFYFTAETTGHGVWVTTDRAMLYHLAPDGTVRRRIQARYPLLPVPGTAPQRFFSRDGLYTLDATYRLHACCRWPVPVPEINDRPYVTDSTLDVLAQGQWLHLSNVRGAHPRLTRTPAGLEPGPAGTRNYTLERDAYGIWWAFSRLWRGCYKQRRAPQVVQPLLRADGQPAGSARLIARLPDGRLLVSTYDGVLAQAADSPTAPLRPFLLQLRLRPHPVPYNGVFNDLWPDRGGRTAVVADELWGVARLDLTTGLVGKLANGPATSWPRETNGPARAFALLRDQTGRLWAGGQTGLFRVRDDGQALRRYADERPDWPLHRLDVHDLAEDPANHALWVATNGGLFWLRPEDQQLHAFAVDARGKRQLPTDALSAVISAGPGRAWVGTHDQGLLLVDQRRGLLRQWSVAEGLPSHSVAGIVLDRRGTPWASTYAGLVHGPANNGQFAVFSEAEGLREPELNRHSALAEADGTLWFGGTGGVFRVRPQAGGLANFRWPAPQLLLTALGQPADAAGAVRLLPAGPVPRLTLAAGPDAFVELHLALTDFFAPDLVRYAYRLRQAAGRRAPSAWLSTPHRLVLRGLLPGDYEVEIRAETSPGQPLANHLRVPLRVVADWWQLPLVWLLVAAGLLAAGYATYWLRLRQVLREAHRRAELAANLHDEVGALLTRVHLLAEVLREHHVSATAAGPAADGFDTRGTLDRLLYNSRAALQTMRDVVWGIDSRADSVAALLHRMREHLDQTAAAAGLVATLSHAGLGESAALPASTRQHLFLIFKEAVTNAARHARTATEISVHLGPRQGKLVLEVSDNGHRPDSPLLPPGGMGLRNMAHRAKALGADLRTGPHPDGRPGYCVLVTLR